MEILFIRHGETEWNRESRIQGGTAEIDINTRGVRQAELTSDGLINAGFHFDHAFASPYRRALHTARILAAPHGIEPIVDERLHEINFGPYEGTSIKDFIDENIRAAFKFPPNYVPPEGAESFEAVDARLRSFLNEVLLPLEGKAETVLVVAHGGVLRAITRIFDTRPLAEFWTAGHQPNCCTHRVICTNGEFMLVDRGLLFYNETQLSES